MAKHVAAYVRVSTTSQNLAGQQQALEQWLQAHHSDAVVHWYVDQESGDTLQRTAFRQLQDAAFAGQVSTVVVYKLDRLSRSLRDGIDTLCTWCDQGIRVVSVTQQLDFAGPAGKLIAGVLFAVAEMEQETRRERQAAGIAAAKQQGKYTGRKRGTTKASPARARELQAKGLRQCEIAEVLGVTRHTVRSYLAAG